MAEGGRESGGAGRETYGRGGSLAADDSGDVGLCGDRTRSVQAPRSEADVMEAAYGVDSVSGEVVEVRVKDDVVALCPVRGPAAK